MQSVIEFAALPAKGSKPALTARYSARVESSLHCFVVVEADASQSEWASTAADSIASAFMAGQKCTDESARTAIERPYMLSVDKDAPAPGASALLATDGAWVVWAEYNGAHNARASVSSYSSEESSPPPDAGTEPLVQRGADIRSASLKARRGDGYLLATSGFLDNVKPMERNADQIKAETAEDWMKYMHRRLFSRTVGRLSDETNYPGFAAIAVILKEVEVTAASQQDLTLEVLLPFAQPTNREGAVERVGPEQPRPTQLPEVGAQTASPPRTGPSVQVEDVRPVQSDLHGGGSGPQGADTQGKDGNLERPIQSPQGKDRILQRSLQLLQRWRFRDGLALGLIIGSVFTLVIARYSSDLRSKSECGYGLWRVTDPDGRTGFIHFLPGTSKSSFPTYVFLGDNQGEEGKRTMNRVTGTQNVIVTSFSITLGSKEYRFIDDSPGKHDLTCLQTGDLR